MKSGICAGAFAILISSSVLAQSMQASEGGPSPAGAKVYFISPKDGETVASPVRVKFGLVGMGIAPAGIEFENTGHHHILVDQEAVTATSPMMKQYMQLDQPNLLHFGKGQTEADVKLAPGKHTLQLVLGDQDHHPHNPPVYSERITITVK